MQNNQFPVVTFLLLAFLNAFGFFVGSTVTRSCEIDCSTKAFAPRYVDPDIFLSAIAGVKKTPRRPQRTNGITVPHHLLAADLIAQGLYLADSSGIDKIVVLFPDHFKKTRRPFATTLRDFETIFGLVRTDQAGAKILLRSDLVEESGLFGRDHGIGALLPFIRHFFPDVPVLPVAVSIRSRRAHWDQLAGELATLIGPSTLIIQSTDFSHYLTADRAARHDQIVLNALASSDLDAIAALRQPDYLDSRGSQYLQLKLQRDLFHARPVALFNSNSQAYSDVLEKQTTSYIVQIYESSDPGAINGDQPGSRIYCFAGDTFFGRGMARALTDERAARRLLGEIKSVLNNCRLVLNLEGVISNNPPRRASATTLAMQAQLTIQWLHQMNVVAVSVANNHRFDLGPRALMDMVATLRREGFAVLQHGVTTNLKPLHVVALTDLDNHSDRQRELVSQADLGHIKARPPLAAFMHWGTERVLVPDERQCKLSRQLGARGVSLIVGAHPHVADRRLVCADDCKVVVAHSLGNFLFDQGARHASGSLLEIRVFEQGTVFARLVPIPNYFDRARQNPALN